jgi:Cd2+/Zn2+-exporting ATPase
LVLGLVFRSTLARTPGHWGEYALLLPAYLISGWGVLTTAGRNIVRGRVFDENFLMTIATLGAIAIHELPEAVGVMLFYQIGEWCQGLAVGRSRRSIRALLAVRPDTAHWLVADAVQTVAPEQVPVGDRILVRPGEKIPLDGDILTGESRVDTAALTGESVPSRVVPGDPVLAGMINQSGSLTVRVTKPFGASSIAKILDLVEHASSKKAATEQFITRFARIYTPIVVALSLLVALVPPMLIAGATHTEWVYRALVLLVISCPCGLVISIPLGYFGGVGGAARQGILVKGSTFLDVLTEVDTVVFDKTGTLTEGNFRVTAVQPCADWSAEALLAIAAQAESQSTHPIAQSICQAVHPATAPVTLSASSAQAPNIQAPNAQASSAQAPNIQALNVQAYREQAGLGVQAQIQQGTENHMVLVGNSQWLKQSGIVAVAEPDTVGTVVHVAIDGSYAGWIVIADELKPGAIAAIAALHRQGLTTAMLTGDRQPVAASVAHTLGIDHYQAELLPEGKVTALETWLHQARRRDRKVAFVGDGINDAPVIARADVGLAMGALGSDAAIETADVVIMTDAPTKVAEAIATAHQTRRIVWQNITLALGVKVVVIGLGVLGLANLWAAVFADVGVALLAVLNATRALHVPTQVR